MDYVRGRTPVGLGSNRGTDRLTLPEEFLLLGWDDERGANRYTANLAMLLGGASILELVLAERLTVSDGRLEISGGPTGDPALDHVLDRVRESRKPRSIKTWVQRLGNRPGLRQRVVRGLVDRGVLRAEQRRILGLFPVNRYPVADPVPVSRVGSGWHAP